MFEDKIADGLNQGLAKLDIEQRILFINERFSRSIMISSFTSQDQYLSWLLTRNKHVTEIFSASSNLPKDVANLKDITQDRYAFSYKTLPLDTSNTISLFAAHITSTLVNDDISALVFACWDNKNKVMEINPLADFTDEAIVDAIFAHEIPVNLVSIAEQHLDALSYGQTQNDMLAVSSQDPKTEKHRSALR